MRPFYRGENIDLHVANREMADETSWPDWLNSQRSNRYTTHAVFPNTVDDQRAFAGALRETNRFALLICPAGTATPIGVISLSGVDYRQGTAAIAIIMDTETGEAAHPLASLEAMALVTTHAFDVMGLRRVEAGQVFPALNRWARMLQAIGYEAEGIKRQAFRRGHQVSDVVLLSVLHDDYSEIVRRRGSLWAGNEAMRRLVAELPKTGFADELAATIRERRDRYRADATPTD